jgi:putative ABC transport system ATP-binding protein
METVIKVDGLTFSFGAGENREPVLQGITMTIEAGEIVILSGPSGSGKTTLLTLMGALRSMQAGSLDVLGVPLQSSSENQRRVLRKRIGFIFQQHNLLGFLTAEQNVQMALLVDEGDRKLTDVADSQAKDALIRVGLAHRIHHYPAELSGGQRQRVAVARALVRQPELILADEPTASLDAASALSVATLFREQADQRGTSVVLVTHDDRLRQVADRIIELRDGRIAA